MEFKSLQDLIRIVENALAVQFFGQSSVLRKGVLKVLAHVVGGALYMVVLIAKRIWKNRFVTTCDDDCLDGFGAEYGLPHKVPTYATGYVVVTPSVMSATIPQDTVFVDSSSKLEYRVTETTDVPSPLASSSTQLVPVIAVEVGYDYNMEAGVPLDFRDTPVADIASVESGVISGGVAEAVEIDGVVQVWGETADSYRARLINRVQNPPHGGSRNDYIQWATRFSFVTNAYPFEQNPNTNSVSVAVANFNSSDVALSPAKVAEVAAYMTDDVRRPITADVRIFSVTPVDVVINAYVSPYSYAVRDSVTAAIKEYLKKTSPGKTVSFSDLEDVVRSNSTAKTFSISSASKDGTSVNSLVFALDLSDDDNPVAEVARLGDGAVVLLSGES